MAVRLYRGAVRAGNAPLGLAVAAPVERRVRQLLRSGGASVTPVTPTPDARSRPGQAKLRRAPLARAAAPARTAGSAASRLAKPTRARGRRSPGGRTAAPPPAAAW